MNTIKPLDISLLFKTFEWEAEQNFAATALIGFSMDDGESMLEADLWKFLAEELGKDQALDFCMPKHNGEVLVYGNYYSPTNKPVTADRVGFSVGNLTKELAVIGDRYWRPVIGPTPPEPFITMPVDFEHAFGGKSFDSNPMGKGIDEVKLETGETVTPMPNIEDPDKLVTDTGHRPEPASFRQIDAMWPQRSSKLGTYDEKWINERAPAYPEDLDWTHFNTASPDQWMDDFFIGNESFEIANMHPDESNIKGNLPGYRVSCFINMHSDQESEPDFKEISMRMDTVCFFPHAKKGVLIYRGTTKVTEDDGSDIKDIVIGYEWLASEKRGLEHYCQAMGNRQNESTKINYMMTTEDLIPEGVRCGFKRILDSVDAPSMEMMKNMEAKGDLIKAQIEEQVEGQKQQLIKQLEAAGIDPAPYLKKFDNASEIDDPDVKRLMDFMNSVVPGATKGNKDTKVSDIDLSKMGDLQKEMELFAESQKKKIKETLAKQADELSGQEATKHAAEELRKAIQKMDEPPPLPRPHLDEVITQLRHNIEQAKQQYHELLEKGVSAEQLKALKIDLDVDALEKQFGDASAQLKGVYRMGAHELPKGDPPHVDCMDKKKEEFDSLFTAGQSLHDGDYAGLDLSGLDLKNIDLSFAYLEDVDLRNVKLDSANLSEAILARSNLTSASITNTNFSGANLGAIIAMDAVFTNCNFTGATLSKSNLENAVFSGCDFTDVYFLEAKLAGIELSNAKLKNAIFLDRDLSGSNFSGSDLSNGTFIDCELSGSNFSEATLFETAFISAKASCSNFANANMTNVRFVLNSDLSGSKFTGACLDKANLRDSDLKQADFTDASINMTDFSGGVFEKAVFNRAKGERPLFIKSDLALADLSNASFYEGSMLKARLTSATLQGSNLYAVEFMGATVGGTDFSGANLDMSKLRDWRPEK